MFHQFFKEIYWRHSPQHSFYRPVKMSGASLFSADITIGQLLWLPGWQPMPRRPRSRKGCFYTSVPFTWAIVPSTWGTPTMLAMVPQKQGGKLLVKTHHIYTGYTAQRLFEQTFFPNLTLLVHTLHTSHFFGHPLFPVSYHSLMAATVIFLSLFLNRDTRCCPNPMFGKQRAGEQWITKALPLDSFLSRIKVQF